MAKVFFIALYAYSGTKNKKSKTQHERTRWRKWEEKKNKKERAKIENAFYVANEKVNIDVAPL